MFLNVKNQDRNTLKLLSESGSGFIALTSAIIIVLVLVTITVILNLLGLFGRFNILDGEFKEKSVGLAEACVDVAIVKIVADPTYTGNECISVGDACPSNGTNNTCTVISVAPSGSNKIIKTQACLNKSYTNLEVLVNGTTFVIDSWNEVPNFDPDVDSC